MSESATFARMDKKELQAIRAAARRAVGSGGAYFVALVDETDTEIITNIDKRDLAKFLGALGGGISEHDKLMKMRVAGRA